VISAAVSHQVYTSYDGKQLTGTRAYAAYRKEQMSDSGRDGGDVGVEGEGGAAASHGGSKGRKKRPSAKNGGAVRPKAPRKYTAAPKRSSGGWDPQAPVTFDV